MRIVLVALFIVSTLSACQKQTFPEANAKKPANAPQYQVEPALNGGVQNVETGQKQ